MLVPFLELAKAFDCVNHDILLRKLPFYGFKLSHLVYKLHVSVESMSKVSVNGSLSDWGMIESGVPWGSILGPLLFSIYINDLPSVVQNMEVNIYDNDSAFHCSADSLDVIENLAQEDMNRLNCWLNSNLLKANVSKSGSIHVHTRFRLVSGSAII